MASSNYEPMGPGERACAQGWTLLVLLWVFLLTWQQHPEWTERLWAIFITLGL